jgi:hypothetical protein
MPLTVMNPHDYMMDNINNLKLLYSDSNAMIHIGLVDTFYANVETGNLLNDCNRGFDAEVLQENSKREVIKTLYNMTRNPNPEKDDFLVLVMRMSGKVRERVETRLDDKNDIPKYYGVLAKPVYMALFLKRYDLAEKLLEQGYPLDYTMPMKKFIISRITRIIVYKNYIFLHDFLLHQDELPEQLERRIWCGIEEEYKEKKLELPFTGKKYDVFENHRIFSEEHVCAESEEERKLYIRKVKKLVDTHPVFFEHLGSDEQLYLWAGKTEQGYELREYLTDKLSYRTDVLKKLPIVFDRKIWQSVADKDTRYNVLCIEKIKAWVAINKKLTRYYLVNDELRQFYCAWIMRKITIMECTTKEPLLERREPVWKELLSMLQQLWMGQHIVDVCSEMYKYKSDFVDTSLWDVTNTISMKYIALQFVMKIVRCLSPTPYCYIFRNSKDIGWLFKVLFYEKHDADYIEEKKKTFFYGISKFQYENEELEEEGYDKLKKLLKWRNEEALLHAVDSGLVPVRYIEKAANDFVEQGQLKQASLLLSRLS